QPGDVLVAVGGESVDQIIGNWLTLRPRPPANWAVGQPVTYVVERGGQQVALEVPLGRRSPSIVLAQIRNAPSAVILLLLFALIGFLVFFRVPRHRAARLMLVLAADEIVGLGVFPDIVGYQTP